jgi:hypothetical protein
MNRKKSQKEVRCSWAGDPCSTPTFKLEKQLEPLHRLRGIHPEIGGRRCRLISFSAARSDPETAATSCSSHTAQPLSCNAYRLLSDGQKHNQLPTEQEQSSSRIHQSTAATLNMRTSSRQMGLCITCQRCRNFNLSLASCWITSNRIQTHQIRPLQAC